MIKQGKSSAKIPFRFEFSAGGIVIKKEKGKTYVLLTQHSQHKGWSFPKGLIEKGVDVNYMDESYGSTPLILSCQYNFVDMAKFLIEKGADVNLQAKNGSTPLIAAAGVSEELVDLLLLKSGYKFEIRNWNGSVKGIHHGSDPRTSNNCSCKKTAG